MKRFLLFNLLLFIMVFNSKAQDTTTVEKLVRYILQPLDKTQVPGGILAEYGAPILDLPTYNGILTDSNKTDITTLRSLFFQLNTSYCGSGTNPFPAIGTFNNLIGQNLHDTLPVPIPIIMASYHRLRDDAVSSNLLSYNSSTQQFHDVPGRSQVPYLQQNLFAAAPALAETYKGSIVFICDSNLIWNTTGKTISQLAIDFDNGEGFQPVTFGQEIAVNYYYTGNKVWTIKAVFTDSTIWQCYSNYQVHEALPLDIYGRYQPDDGYDLHVPFEPTGSHSGANVYVAYTNLNRSNTLRKPLIVVEGYDVGNILPDMGRYTYKDFIRDIETPSQEYDFNNQLDDEAGYDIVFVDFRNGTDYIERNAALLEEVVAWVNTNKVLNSNNGNVMEDNLVLGISMGGLVARYALANMTKNSIATQTRLLITHDSPHRGANVPLGLQYLIRMTGNVSVFGFNVRDLYPEYEHAISLLGQPATQQMLIYRSVSENTFAANTFLDGQYRNMVTFSPSGPQPSYRFIATSNGSECGNALFSPYQQFLNAQLTAGLSVIIASYKFSSTAEAFALPSAGQTSKIAKLYIQNRLRVLFISKTKVLCDKTAYAPGSHLPVDGAPGGISPFTNGGPVRAMFNLGSLVAGYAQGNPTNFTFVPTASALDINTFNVSSLSQRYVLGVNSDFPSAAQNYIANESSGLGNNISHTRFTARNANWLYNEMENVTNNTINCSSVCPPNVAISGPSQICSPTETYSIPNLPTGATVTWTTTGSISISGANNVNPVSVTKSSNGTGTLTANISTACGSFSVVKNNIQVGLPTEPLFTTNPQVRCMNSPYYLSLSLSEGTSVVSITGLKNGINKLLAGAGATACTVPEDILFVTFNLQNTCGTATYTIRIARNGRNCPIYRNIYPNPANTNLTIELNPDGDTLTKSTGYINEISLYNNKGKEVKSATIKSGETKTILDTKNLPNGTYFLHIKEGKEIIKKQIIIEH